MFNILTCACYHVPADEKKVTDEETGLRGIPMAIISKQTTHERNISSHYKFKSNRACIKQIQHVIDTVYFLSDAAQASFICSVFWAIKCLVYLPVLVIMYQLMKKKWLMKKQVSESFLWRLYQSRQLMRGTFLFITMLKKQSLHKTDTTCHWYSICLEWWLHKPVSFAVFSAHYHLICQSL